MILLIFTPLQVLSRHISESYATTQTPYPATYIYLQVFPLIGTMLGELDALKPPIALIGGAKHDVDTFTTNI